MARARRGSVPPRAAWADCACAFLQRAIQFSSRGSFAVTAGNDGYLVIHDVRQQYLPVKYLQLTPPPPGMQLPLCAHPECGLLASRESPSTALRGPARSQPLPCTRPSCPPRSVGRVPRPEGQRPRLPRRVLGALRPHPPGRALPRVHVLHAQPRRARVRDRRGRPPRLQPPGRMPRVPPTQGLRDTGEGGRGGDGRGVAAGGLAEGRNEPFPPHLPFMLFIAATTTTHSLTCTRRWSTCSSTRRSR